jgi:hypothetical protein
MDTKQISPLLVTAILALVTSLTFSTSCTSDEQEQNTVGAVAPDNTVYPNTIKRREKPIKIKFKVRGNGDQGLQIDWQDRDDCESHGHGIGCIKIDRGNYGLIEFTFIAEAPWKLTQLTICKGSTKDGCIANLEPVEQLEFFVTNDRKLNGGTVLVLNNMGVIDLTKLAGDIKTFYLYDQNTFTQTYFYNIVACTDPGDPKTCLTLDPPVENKG